MWHNYIIKLPVCVVRCVFAADVVVGNSAEGGALYCLIGGRHRRSYTAGFPSEQSADNRRTILTLPSVLSAVCIAQN